MLTLSSQPKSINTTSSGEQQDVRLAALPNGNWVAVWADRSGNDGSEGGIFGQILDSNLRNVGNEFLVNTNTGGWQSKPQVASTSSGDFLVTWHEGNGYLSAQLYTASGTKS